MKLWQSGWMAAWPIVDRLAILVGMVSILVFFSPIWAGGLVFISDGQLGAFFAPLSLWSNDWVGGWPVAADNAAYVAYPVRLLVLASKLGFNVFVVSAYVVAMLGVYTYLRLLGTIAAAALLGSLGFAFSGFMIAHLGHTSMIHAAAWIPWILAGIEGHLSNGQRRWTLVCALATALTCLAGHMQISFYGLILSGAYGVWRFPACRREGNLRRWGMIWLALAIGLALAAPQLLLTIRYLAETPRMKMDYDAFITYSLPTWQLPTVLFPFFFGSLKPNSIPYIGAWNLTEMCIYMPFLFVMLAIVGSIMRERAIGRFWLLVSACALLLALGGSFPSLARVVYEVPGFNKFRVPARHAMEFCLTISILAGLGLHRLLTAPTDIRLRRLFGAGAVLCAILAVVASYFSYGAALSAAHHFDGGYALPPWSANPGIGNGLAGIATGLAASLLLAMRPCRRSTVAMTMAAACFGIWLFAWNNEWRFLSQPKTSFAAKAIEREIGARIASEGGRVLFAPFGTTLSPERTRLLGVPSINWYGPMLPLRAAAMLDINTPGFISGQALTTENHALDLYGVRYMVFNEANTNKQECDSACKDAIAGTSRWRLSDREGNIVVYENLRALPLAWLCGTWDRLKPEAILERIHHDASFDPRREALVTDLTPARIADFDTGTVTAHWLSNDTIAATVTSATGGFLVFSVNDMDGWTTYVDGEPQPTYRANYALFGLNISAGHHELRLQYRMPGWIWALPAGAALLGLVVLFKFGGRSVVRRNRN